jgi:hypothetical protein
MVSNRCSGWMMLEWPEGQGVGEVCAQEKSWHHVRWGNGVDLGLVTN